MTLIKLLITNCDINRFIIKIKKAASASSAAAEVGANVINKIVVVAVIVFVFVFIHIKKSIKIHFTTKYFMMSISNSNYYELKDCPSVYMYVLGETYVKAFVSAFFANEVY